MAISSDYSLDFYPIDETVYINLSVHSQLFSQLYGFE